MPPILQCRPSPCVPKECGLARALALQVGGNHIVSCQWPPDPFQLELTHWLDLHGERRVRNARGIRLHDRFRRNRLGRASYAGRRGNLDRPRGFAAGRMGRSGGLVHSSAWKGSARGPHRPLALRAKLHARRDVHTALCVRGRDARSGRAWRPVGQDRRSIIAERAGEGTVEGLAKRVRRHRKCSLAHSSKDDNCRRAIICSTAANTHAAPSE